MYKKLNWVLLSNEDRTKVIEAVKNAISSSDGCIINFNMFSDLALALSIEIEENRISVLHKALSNIVKISDFDYKETNLNSKDEWLILMNISFGGGTGELKIKVPVVPG